jgi:putative nucleotidyltransferase-like protein
MSAALVAAGVALVDEMASRGLTLRLLGGAGIVVHCGGTPHREIGDLDGLVPRADGRAVAAALPEAGYEPEARFNALHGDRRMIFHGPEGKLDVFVGAFEMCHVLELNGRVKLDSPALTASDLLLTKLQIVELNAKDAQDAALLLRAHALGHGDGDQIDVDYLTGLVARDWGLWRTTSGTLSRLAELEPSVAAPADALEAAFAEVPKTRAWRLRARVGERKRWYELPDEVG